MDNVHGVLASASSRFSMIQGCINFLIPTGAGEISWDFFASGEENQLKGQSTGKPVFKKEMWQREPPGLLDSHMFP